MKITKRMKKRDEGVDFSKVYTPLEAFSLLKDRSKVKFDETVEFVMMCRLDPRKSDHSIRAMVSLPQGTGKTVKIAVFAQGEQAQQAKTAGADIVGGEELVEEVMKGMTDFDLCIATPAMMGQMGKLGKVLGPKGLMPNVKLGTVTTEVAHAVNMAKKGQVALRADKQGIVHALIGKLTFSSEGLAENLLAIYEKVQELRPSGIKGNLVKKAYVSSTMGFSLLVDLSGTLS